MALYGTYDPNKTTISVAGINITGFAAGTFVQCERNEDGFSLVVGADGNATRVRNQNRSGKITLTLQQGSPSNATLSALAVADELDGSGVGAFLAKDASATTTATLASAQNVWITKLAPFERGKEAGEVVWVLETDTLLIKHAGLE